MDDYITKHGDALSHEEGIIVHGCNCHGVMGAGIAKSIKNCFPNAYNVYRHEYENNGLFLGNITYTMVLPNKIIVNANTQYDTGTDKRYVNYEAVAKCFSKVLELADLQYSKTGKKLDIVFPMIGAGLAGGNWKIIETIILETIGNKYRKILYLFP